MYSGLIEAIFDKIGYKYGTNFKALDEYYHCHNPLNDDSGSKSAMIWKDTGALKMYNDVINNKTHFPLKEWVKMIGCIDLYAEFVVKSSGIRVHKLNKYRDLLVKSSILRLSRDEITEKKALQAVFKEIGLSRSDVLGTSSITTNTSRRFEPKARITSSNKREVIPSDKDYNRGVKYLEKRNLPVVPNICYPSSIVYSTQDKDNMIDLYKVPVIGLRYPNGFVKFRYLHNKGGRYTSDGS